MRSSFGIDSLLSNYHSNVSTDRMGLHRLGCFDIRNVFYMFILERVCFFLWLQVGVLEASWLTYIIYCDCSFPSDISCMWLPSHQGPINTLIPMILQSSIKYTQNIIFISLENSYSNIYAISVVLAWSSRLVFLGIMIIYPDSVSEEVLSVTVMGAQKTKQKGEKKSPNGTQGTLLRVHHLASSTLHTFPSSLLFLFHKKLFLSFIWFCLYASWWQYLLLTVASS